MFGCDGYDVKYVWRECGGVTLKIEGDVGDVVRCGRLAVFVYCGHVCLVLNCSTGLVTRYVCV